MDDAVEPQERSETPAPVWALIPESVTVHHEVDLGKPDPAHSKGFQSFRHDERRCVAARRDGHRCRGCALDDALLCPIHEGRADPQMGAQASKAARESQQQKGQEIAALRRLGTRAMVAQALVANAENINKAISVLARSAADGDVRSAQALIPWVNQALGMPTERVEVSDPTTLDDLEGMTSAQLEAKVAEGRARRLRLVQEQEQEDARDAGASAEPG